jgi:DNA modification methylase
MEKATFTTEQSQTLCSANMQAQLLQRFIEEFLEITGLHPSFDVAYLAELNRLVTYLKTRQVRPLDERRKEFLGYINYKFRLNAEPLALFYAEAAKAGFTFHYHQKCRLQRAFDVGDRDIFVSVLDERTIPEPVKARLLRFFVPIDKRRTLEYLSNECKEPSMLRKAKENRDIEGEIVKALFSAFIWVSLPEREMHRFFDPHYSDADYRESFWEQLHVRSPHLFSRDNALHVVRVNRDVLRSLRNAEQVRGAISKIIARLYEVVNNYGFLAIVIESLQLGGRAFEWELAADTTLFAEKHREALLRKSYFRWKRVQEDTAEHIPHLDISAAHFELVNEGFTYRDCFVLTSKNGDIHRLLLIFQKNERDETPIPCPTCRSANVQGNSYPSLGVRSWECNNMLCPDRSKYNRGKRYSFRGLAMQQAINDDRNEIPVESIRRWMRDVVTGVSDDEIAEMLVRHYSMYDDTIHVHNWLTFHESKKWGRRIKRHELLLEHTNHPFWSGPFFRRYVIPSQKCPTPVKNLGDNDFQILLGDSGEVLRSLPEAMFDGAVTSPPYYNAREYAQWSNIYCYLHDMFDINREVYRTLKPGALYLYNVFDYFDNENTIVFSAMGQRRMLLSAYTVDLFRRIGFEFLGNVVWDKGDIEGKRGFNAGNFSPYYQSPFNCWEHVLVFRKPTRNEKNNGKSSRKAKDPITTVGSVSQVLRSQPVIKIVRGENVHGHTAPFPETIPELLISRMSPGMAVLDPFGGSLTTGRVAERFGLRSVCIERSEEYCRLGLRLRLEERESERAARSQLALF